MITHANSHQATDPTDHATMSERALAAKVIQQAILDFVSTPPRPYRGQFYGFQQATQQWEERLKESYEFLTGAGAMSAFWFASLELPFFPGSFEDLQKRLKGQSLRGVSDA